MQSPVRGPLELPLIYGLCGAFLITWQRFILSVSMVHGMAEHFELALENQANVLSVFMGGYMIGNTGMTRVLNRTKMPKYLPTYMIGISIFWSSVCMYLIAFYARNEFELILCRVTKGIVQAAFYPSLWALFAQVYEGNDAAKTTASGRTGAAGFLSIAGAFLISAAYFHEDWQGAISISCYLGIIYCVCLFCSRDAILERTYHKIQDHESYGPVEMREFDTSADIAVVVGNRTAVDDTTSPVDTPKNNSNFREQEESVEEQSKRIMIVMEGSGGTSDRINKVSSATPKKSKIGSSGGMVTPSALQGIDYNTAGYHLNSPLGSPNEQGRKNKRSPAFRKLVCSGAFLAVVAGHSAHNFGSYVLVSWLPTFFGKDRANFATFPYILATFITPLYPVYVERAINEGRHTLWRIRQRVSLICLLTPACCLVYVAILIGDSLPAAASSVLVKPHHDDLPVFDVLTTSQKAALAFSLAVAGGGALNASVLCGPLDLTDENAAGSLLATSNLLAGLPGMFGVKIAAWLKVHYGWSAAFYVMAMVYATAQIIYWNFGSASRLQFDNDDEDEDDDSFAMLDQPKRKMKGAGEIGLGAHSDSSDEN